MELKTKENMENLHLVTEKIKAVKASHKFINKAKKLRLAYYSGMCQELSYLSTDTILSHNFERELLDYSNELEKTEFVNRKLKKHIGIETHLYAPELNKIHIFSAEIKAARITEISEAVKYLIRFFSLSDLQRMAVDNY